MKNLILLGLVLASLNTIQAQEFICGNGRISISDVVCNENELTDPSDNYLTYTVTSLNIQSSTVIKNIPSGSSKTGNGVMESNTLYLGQAGVTYITSPSPDCAPLNLKIDIAPNFNGAPCYDFSATIVAASIIPTLSQWAIIILALTIVIFGFLAIKVKSAIPTS